MECKEKTYLKDSKRKSLIRAAGSFFTMWVRMMIIIQLLAAAIILGIVYKKMIKWEQGTTITKKQAFVPIALGAVGTIITFVLFLAINISLMQMGYTVANIQNLLLRSLTTSFLRAGLIEELSRLLMILLAVRLCVPKNLYEYILTGAAVGIGITLLEELLYGESIEALLRITTLGVHTVLGIIMGKYLGLGKHRKEKGLSCRRQYIMALAVPVLMHTIYDACTVFNPALYLNDFDDYMMGIWLLVGLVCIVFTTVYQFVVIKKIKRDAEKYSQIIINKSLTRQ